MNNSYLDKKVNSILEPMLLSVVKKKPNDPVLYMIKWLNNHCGHKEFCDNSEINELKHLRKEIVKIRMSLQVDEELQVLSDDENKENEGNEEDNEALWAAINKKIETKASQRTSVSAEAFGVFNKKEIYIPKTINKTAEQIWRIQSFITKSILFNSLDAQELTIVINSLQEKSIK